MIQTNKPILDACCGSRMFWKDRKNPNVVFVDNRVVEDKEIWRSRNGVSRCILNVRPDVVADFTALPFADETFWHVVFDPPHLFSSGGSSWMREKYGALDRETWPDTIKRGFDECWRVLRTNGTLVFKWSEHDVKIGTVLAVIGRPPLYGHITGKGKQTLWAAFVKLPEGKEAPSRENP